LCDTVEAFGCVGESLLGKVEQRELHWALCVDGLASKEL
jgi:hypothetical protein